MGLDVSFYHQGEELFYFRNHREFSDFFHDYIGGRVSEEYDDFYVTEDTLDVVASHLNEIIAPANLKDLNTVKTIPKSFGDDPHDRTLEEMLPYYVAILERMYDVVVEHGAIICSYSA